MGGGVSKAPYESIEAALADGKTQEEIDAWQAANNNNTKDDNNNAENDTVESNNNGEENGGDGGGPDWMAMFAHKGDYEAQKEKFGPAPDCTNPTEGWYWYGQDGQHGPELKPEIDEAKLNVADRPADVFYVHPTTYVGDLWNMPIAEKACHQSTDYYIHHEASVFNGSCRLFIPKFRQSVIAGMGFPDEGKLTTELAYLDIKKAFEYYLTNENKGRPFILASHSQGSLYTMRLMLEFIEGKELFSRFVACYGLASWAPLSLFQGDTAVFKQIKLCQGPEKLGCYISWNCEHPDTAKQHDETKDSKEPGDWYPQMGHKMMEENVWRIAHGEPIVCTNPFTWMSNQNDEAYPSEEWMGMLNLLNGSTLTTDDEEVKDMDTMMSLLFTPNATIQLKKLVKMTPDEFNAKFSDESTKFKCVVNMKSGDLQLVALPVEIAGSSIQSYEHMNFLLFWFNIRNNVAARIKKFLEKEV